MQEHPSSETATSSGGRRAESLNLSGRGSANIAHSAAAARTARPTCADGGKTGAAGEAGNSRWTCARARRMARRRQRRREARQVSGREEKGDQGGGKNVGEVARLGSGEPNKEEERPPLLPPKPLGSAVKGRGRQRLPEKLAEATSLPLGSPGCLSR